MNTNILDTIRTIEEVHDLVSGIELLIKSVFMDPKNNKSRYSEIRSQMSQDQSEIILEYLGESHISLTDVGLTLPVLEKLKEELLRAKVAHIIVAIAPKYPLVQKISRFLREKLDSTLMLQISVDPILIGGLVLIYDGRYYNLSIAHKIEHRVSDIYLKTVSST